MQQKFFLLLVALLLLITSCSAHSTTPTSTTSETSSAAIAGASGSAMDTRTDAQSSSPPSSVAPQESRSNIAAAESLPRVAQSSSTKPSEQKQSAPASSTESTLNKTEPISAKLQEQEHPAPAAPEVFPDTVKPNQAKSKAPRSSTASSSKPVLTIHVIDKLGNPVPELPITVHMDDGTNMLGLTNAAGQVDWTNPKAGNFNITIDETFKIFRSQEYRVTVMEDFAPIELVWDYEDPSKFPLPIKSTITMSFLDAKNKPLAGFNVDIGINANEKGVHTEEVLMLGKTDANGQILWENPDLGAHEIFIRFEKQRFHFPIDIPEHKDTHLTFIAQAS